MASAGLPQSSVVLDESEIAHGVGVGVGRAIAAVADGGQGSVSRTGTDDGGYNSSTSAANPDGRVKRRKTGAVGSRGVANLTPEQLEKKRANDREAQRAIRERTKTQIESLQRQIHELRSQQPQLELQAALRAKEEVEAELIDIKRRLASVLSMIQPILSGTDQLPIYPSPGHTYALPTSQRPDPPSLNNASTPSTAGAPSPTSVAPPSLAGHWLQHPGDVTSAGPSPPTAIVHHHHQQQQQQQQAQPYLQTKLLTQQRHELIHGLDFGAERLGLDFLLDYPTQRVARIQNGVNGAQDSPHFTHVPMKHDWATGVMQGQGGPGVNALGPASASSFYSPPPPGGPSLPPGDSYAGYSAPVKNCAPTCPLDRILLDFLQERQQRAAEGLSAQEIIGPRYPSVSSLLNPAVSRFSHPLSKVFTDILQTFPDISALPERVAVLYIMFLLMRWQISPTRENYDRLPEWATPRPSQLFTPHPAWMDHLPFPRMREKLVRDYYGGPSTAAGPSSSPAGAGVAAGPGGAGLVVGGPGDQQSSPNNNNSGSNNSNNNSSAAAAATTAGDNFPFENFFIPYTTTLSLNWPYEDIDVLLQSPDTEELMVNPVFERHLRRLENWTLGDAFAKTFPGLVDTFNLKSESDGVIKLAR